ncbi:DUF308 domain-containing protein [Rhodopseudomonas sp. HC1]|uniref:DUF308 domain-containing protein n=1 Tax=Rhodopseudomonas infernalis TaxID=2897386 RepID=UPI001EE7836C|nr:DUF308 domain-containing protein [Rhodopseudomonas infernalis]MCG6204459.1 DUF308 domain-containing protein [Rhodopseudomonas infernalis]
MAHDNSAISSTTASAWLKRYYYVRAAFSLIWVALAFTVARQAPQLAAVMLIVYPAWDAGANYADAARNGGLLANPSQALNLVVSALTTLAAVVVLNHGMNAVLAVYGAWAIVAGVLQLVTGVRRWTSGGQWPMILSGAQSALAGAFFIHAASGDKLPSITDIAPYAAFGAFYFLVAAVWLTVKDLRRRTIHVRA